MKKIYIGVGSNILPKYNIKKALDLLKKDAMILKVSTLYKTKPVLRKNQDDFLNGVWEISCNATPEELKFDILKKIETALVRNRTDDRHASRTIDLDILLYDDMVINKKNLVIPDPDIYIRDFIYKPLYELNPDLVIPDTCTPLVQITKKSKEKLQPDTIFTEILRNIVLETSGIS